jgi:hypothetical protein
LLANCDAELAIDYGSAAAVFHESFPLTLELGNVGGLSFRKRARFSHCGIPSTIHAIAKKTATTTATSAMIAIDIASAAGRRVKPES